MDEKGVVHYEAIGPGQAQTSNADQPKPNARRPLDRNHAGLTSVIMKLHSEPHKREIMLAKVVLTETIIDIPEPFRRERPTWELSLLQADWL